MGESDAVNGIAARNNTRNNETTSKDIDPDNLDVTEVTSTKSDDLFSSDDVGRAYLAKFKLISDSIDNIGFGKYQYRLLLIAGFGWFVDNAWPTATSLILPRLGKSPEVTPYITLAQNLGLLAGAFFWSTASDIIGRRLVFNITLFIIGVFATSAGASPSFAALGVFAALWSFGVGGSLPVDSVMFLEVLPNSQKWVLTGMSVFWALGQLVVNLIAWGLLGNFSCNSTTLCKESQNSGWRYFLYTLGGLTLLMFVVRFAFQVHESPKFYIARNDYEKTIETIDKIAITNKKPNYLTIEILSEVDCQFPDEKSMLKISAIKFENIRQCFATRRLRISSSLVIFTWGLIGLAFPLYNAFLPYFLTSRHATKPLSVYETYRNTLIVSAVGVPSSLLAALLVELRTGRRGALFASLLLTGIVLFCSTTANSSDGVLGWNCAFNFASNIVYAVLYAYTPEVFPSKIRGTAIGLASASNRVFGVFAPIIAIYGNLSTSAPIYVSGALFIVSSLLVVFFPYEPKSKASL